jgi:type IV pilus assembly protein PilQ
MRRLIAGVSLAVLLAATPGTPALVSLDVRDVAIADVVALLAAESGKNIVIDDSVKPERVTLRLRNVPFEEALAVLVDSHGLQVHQQGGVLIVGSADAMNRRYDGSTGVLGSQTVVFPLTHAHPDDVAKEITDALPAGTVIIADKRTDAVVVTGDADTVARAHRLVVALDAAGRRDGYGVVTQSYKLRFVRSDEALKQLKALIPEVVALSDVEHNAVVVSGDEVLQATATALFGTIDRASEQVMFEVKVADVTPDTTDSNFGLEFGGADINGRYTPGSTTYAFTGGSVPINVTLNALVSQGRAQILATPKLVTLNNREADLLIGETYPIVFNTSVLGGQNVQFVDIGVKLRLTPTIGPDGVVTAEIHPEYSELLQITTSGYPVIANRKIDSVLRVGDSQTIVLGGLLRDVDNETITKVPGLADVPILGKFFQNKAKHHERDEIVFLITPHVIYPDGPVPTHL